MADLSKDALLALLEAIPSCPSACVPSAPMMTLSNSIETKSAHRVEKPSSVYLAKNKVNRRSCPKRLLPPGVKARYLDNGEVAHVENTPNALAKYLRIKPAKFVLTGHEWDGTIGVQGYRTILHAFTVNGYEVDIGSGWGKYNNESIKPYAKFDARKGV